MEFAAFRHSSEHWNDSSLSFPDAVQNAAAASHPRRAFSHPFGPTSQREHLRSECISYTMPSCLPSAGDHSIVRSARWFKSAGRRAFVLSCTAVCATSVRAKPIQLHLQYNYRSLGSDFGRHSKPGESIHWRGWPIYVFNPGDRHRTGHHRS